MEHPKFRLALEGGGARIFAHIAALEAVRDCDLPISAISGVSAGAIAAVLFSADVRLNHIQAVLEDNKHKGLTGVRFEGRSIWSDLFFVLKILRSIAFIKREKDHKRDPLQQLLSDIIFCRHGKETIEFRSLKPPVVITATDLLSRQDQLYGNKYTAGFDVVTAMAASANIPFVFYGRKQIGPRHQVDGGLFCNIPIDELTRYADDDPDTRDDTVIALVFSDNSGDMPPTSLRGFIFSLINTMLSAPTRRLERNRPPHIEIIRLDCADVGTFDFDRARQIILEGMESKAYSDVYAAVTQRIKEIQSAAIERSTSQYREVQRAVETADRLKLYAPKREWLENRSERYYTCISVPYTDIKQVSQLQDRIFQECESLFKPGLVPEHVQADPDERTQRRFDAFKRPEIAISNEAIYSFPFFLTPFRRSSWGVIPYARHRAVGLAVAENLPRFEELRKLSTEDLQTLPTKLGSANKWLERVFEIFDVVDGNVYSIDGYMHGELVPLLIRYDRDEGLQSRFLRIGRPVEGAKISSTGEYKFEFDLPVLDKLRAGKAAIIFDLADRKLIEKAVGSGFGILSFVHPLDIPIGIGFSLPIVYDLKTDNRWKNLASTAFETLRLVRSPLLEAGIELMDERNFLSRTT